MKKIILPSAIIFCCLQVTYAQHAGDLDPSFGNNGLVTADLGKYFTYGQYDPATQVLLQPDGSMYFLHGVITKRRSNGSIDSSFGAYAISQYRRSSSVSKPTSDAIPVCVNFSHSNRVVLAMSLRSSDLGLNCQTCNRRNSSQR